MTRLVKTKENINGLPIGFQEVEYLQSSGTEWIDTGVTINTATDEVEMYFQLISTTLYQWLMGEHDNGARFGVGVGDGTNKRNIAYGATTYKVNDTQVYNSIHKFVANSNGVYLDGVQVHAFESFSSTSTIYLFNLNISGGAGLASGKIWAYRHKRNGVLIRDFIPCIDNNGKPCMYDKVSGQLFYNKGTGDFSYGREIHYVNYLESTGTQYIDTGINPTDDYGYRIKNTYTVGQGEQCAIGCMDAGNRFVGIYTSGSANAISGAWSDYVGFLPSYPWTTDTILDVKCNYKNSRKIIIDNTEMKDISDIHITGTISNSIYIGARHYGSNVTKMQGKIYSAEITNGTEVIADFIPAIDENGVGFMFDRVTHSCYLNNGTGTFSYGSPVYTTKTRFIKDVDLPSGFRRVEYLEGTGTQYINTGLVSTNKSTIDITFSFSTMDSGATNNCAIFGGRSSSTYTTNTFTMFKLASGSPQYFRFDYNGQVNIGSASQLTWNTSSKYRFTYNGTTRTIENITTGEKVTASLSPATSYTTQPICLFAVNTMGTAGQFMKGRIYGYEYSDGTNTIKLVPAINSSNKPCMYDVVSGTPYYNLGSGEFNYGNILPSKEKTRLILSWLDDYTFVNYIQSTGTQYIDTGITLTNNHSVEIDYQLTQASQSRAGLFGNLNMTGSNQGRFGSLLSPSNQQLEHGYGTGNDYWQQGSPDTNRHKLYQKKNEIYFDGTLIHTFASATFTLNTTAPLGSFGYTNYTPAKAKYYNSKWWDSDTLIRNFIPAIRKSDSAVGMLDIVNRVFYTNQGTGVFSYG